MGALDQMRQHEGEHLRADLDRRRDALAVMIERVAAAAAVGRANLETRLAERVRELTRDLPTDPAAIAQEIVRTAARSDISEEIAVSRDLAHWTALDRGVEPKRAEVRFPPAGDEPRDQHDRVEGETASRVTELIVNAKAELEKMREQVQNVE